MREIELRNGELANEMARKAIKESDSVQYLTFLAAVFLPMNLITVSSYGIS
jgi:Mg2+ and Co2+ transporter CorA